MTEILAASPLLFAVLASLFGLLVGSFLNVVIHRLPIMMERDWREQCAEIMGQEEPEELPKYNLTVPRSACPRCGHMITALENIPVISYVIQRGKCKGCAAHISLQYPLVEAFSGLLTFITAWHFGFGWQAGASLLLLWALIAMSGIDFKHQLLPDSLTLPFLWLGLFCALFGLFVDLRTAVIGAMVGYLFLWIIYQGFKLLTGKEGMGFGDFKLLALFGAWQGWENIIPIVMVSSIVGAVVGIALIVIRGRDRNIPMPFGPFLAAAGWITHLWGTEINAWYQHALGVY